MLEPYIILDFTDHRGEIGPMILGDLGADVIRVELPGGSAARSAAPQIATGAPPDMGSLQFLAFNRNKRSIVLDAAVDEDCTTLVQLIERADFIFESSPSDALSAFGIGFAEARSINPRIVHVRLSAFGDAGPHADFVGNDLVIAAMGGPVSLQGATDRQPIRVSVPQVWRHAGIEAAAGALVAHAEMRRTGVGRFVDLSAQSCMTWTMLNSMDAYAIQGFDFEQGGSGMGGIEIVHPTSDGYIVALPMSAVLSGCTEWMIADGVVDASFRDMDWLAYDMGAREPDNKPLNVAGGIEILRRFLVKHTRFELFEFGLKHGITFAPVNGLTELLDLEHLQTRDYWRDLPLPNGTSVKAPGIWGKLTNSPLEVRRNAPGLGEHTNEIRAWAASALDAQSADESDNELPFEGVRVTDFAWVGVGPISSKYLADHGASVVRVESENRLDVLRGGAPFKDAEPGFNRSQFYGDFNTSKQSLALDMKKLESVEIARKLIARSDVLIESFAPGAIGRMGLGYDEVRKLNPGLIMVSTCLMGQTGPAAGLAGYGYHAAAIAGFYETTGWPDLPPEGPWVAYTDTIAPRFVSVLLAAALDHKRRTGEGSYLDVAQIETALHFLAPEVLDMQVNGYSATRLGNRSPHAAPQSCYRCAGEWRWCAIAIDTEDQWAALCEVIGRDDWISEYASHAARLAAHDEIDTAIADWTVSRDAAEVMATLQAAAVPAGVVQRSQDLLSDPQYAHRSFYHYMDHPEMGHIPYAGHQFRISGYDNGPRGPAPILGEHSFEVLTNVLGFTDEEVGSAFASGAIT
jgi:crotonobetainyl-CoA:carnitine CoA-transferase CaiB-like acyl-CoA transferase